jgi:competence protein ComGC
VVAAKAKRKSLKNFSLAYMVMMVLIGSVLIFIAIGIYTSMGNGIINKGIFPQIMQAGDRFKNIEMAEKMKIWQ